MEIRCRPGGPQDHVTLINVTCSSRTGGLSLGSAGQPRPPASPAHHLLLPTTSPTSTGAKEHFQGPLGSQRVSEHASGLGGGAGPQEPSGVLAPVPGLLQYLQAPAGLPAPTTEGPVGVTALRGVAPPGAETGVQEGAAPSGGH